LSDGDRVSLWSDSSGNGHDASQSGTARPVFKTNILNGKPVVRFTATGSQFFNIPTPVPGAHPWTIFTVFKPVSTSVIHASIASATAALAGLVAVSDGNLYIVTQGWVGSASNAWAGGFHIFTTQALATGVPLLWVDGTSASASQSPGGGVVNFDAIGNYVGNFSDGDIAEIIMYSGALTLLRATDRANIEKYLGTKYGIGVAGGSAVQPDTVTGLLAWWKADSL